MVPDIPEQWEKTCRAIIFLDMFFHFSLLFFFLDDIKYGNTFLQKVWMNLISSGLVL